MEKAEFIFTLAAGFFSVFLLGWHGYNGYTTDWIYGFLAVFWSLIMMLRLMTLTAPYEPVSAQSNLAQKLIRSFREKQEQNRQQILENSFGGSFALFLGATFVFAAWQIFVQHFRPTRRRCKACNPCSRTSTATCPGPKRGSSTGARFSSSFCHYP